MKSKNLFAGVLSFFKRNAYYVVLFICIAGIATMITLAALSGTGTPADPDPIIQPPPVEEPVDNNKPILFSSPIETFTAGQGFSGKGFIQYLSLNGSFRTHAGIDMIAAEGTKVMAAYDGVVESVGYNPLDGFFVKIKHNDDLTTVYKSLSEDTKVKAGDKVLKGDVIGYVSTTMGVWSVNEAHLHFEVLYKNNLVDPMNYLEEGDK